MVLMEISVEEASKKLGQKNVFLLDVRLPEEFAVSKIKGFHLIPLHELPSRIGELSKHKKKEILVICHHGSRSLYAASMLRNAGYNAKSIVGGLASWSEKIDKSIPKYIKGPFGVMKA